ncbi:NAD-dependent epimerase/dehydratase family protein [Fontibacter flavus]|uniref:NAD-dependent epimerase/dehydratase family protein n=1 Tax=Fontibacter flavus TaxID=654838 RepID=A0ABV6FV65_9BACT
MKVFVTGGTGYIGSRLIQRLLEKVDVVRALYRNEHPAIDHPSLEWVKGELDEEEKIVRLLEGCHQVYHMAGLARMWHPQKNAFFDTNVASTDRILKAAERVGISRIVFTSTASVISYSIKTPIQEEDPLIEPFDDEYSASKFVAEQMVLKASKPGFETVVVNPPRVYGPSMIGNNPVNNLVKGFLKRRFYFVPGDGSYEANYAFIDDVVNGHILAMEKGRPGQRYILGGENHSYNSFYQVLEKELHLKRNAVGMPRGLMSTVAAVSETMSELFGKAPFITGPMVNKLYSNRLLSVNKAANELGYIVTPLAEGLRKTIQFINHSNGPGHGK